MSSGDVWIIGTHMTRFGRFGDKDLMDLAVEATQGALKDADSDLAAVDVLAVGNLYEATSHNGQRLTEGTPPPVDRVIAQALADIAAA